MNWNHWFHVTNTDNLSLLWTEIPTLLSDKDLVYWTVLSKGRSALNDLMISEQWITWKDMVIILRVDLPQQQHGDIWERTCQSLNRDLNRVPASWKISRNANHSSKMFSYFMTESQIRWNVCVRVSVLKCLVMPSDFHIPLPSIVQFAHSETSFTHGCIYPKFPGSLGTSFFRSFRFPVDHNFWQSNWVHSLNMSIPNELFSRVRWNCPFVTWNVQT
jgi:hypothetical protein